MAFERRALRPGDVAIEILFCGVCHSDLHQVRDDWNNAKYPMIPGHEIIGRVTAVGSGVSEFKAGDAVGVGCLVDSCMECDQCRKGEEQLCRKRATQTYNDTDRKTGEPTFGGYSQAIVVRQEFVLKVSDKVDLARVAPLLCAGITTYSPLKRWNAGPGTRLGVVGLGGLGHMAVKLGVALGCEVTVITTSDSKTADAHALGAHNVLVSRDEDAMKAATSSMDLIIDTVPVAHDLAPYIRLLDIDGSLVIVGAIDTIPGFHSGLLLGGRKRVSGSPIGGIQETQELLDLCADHGIHADCETIAMQDIQGAYARMDKSDVKYRFVIDMSTLAKDAA
jgi:uncharacterized zinc-type alcohol dehydrogenase-like protein